MASSQHDVIDFSALERELRASVASERKRQRENEAKLRAVSQRTTYQEFRDLVLASHLTPLQRTRKDESPRKQPWNPLVAPATKNT